MKKIMLAVVTTIALSTSIYAINTSLNTNTKAACECTSCTENCSETGNCACSKCKASCK